MPWKPELTVLKERERNNTFWRVLSLTTHHRYSSTTPKLKDKASSGRQERHAPKRRKFWVPFSVPKGSCTTTPSRSVTGWLTLLQRCHEAFKRNNESQKAAAVAPHVTSSSWRRSSSFNVIVEAIFGKKVNPNAQIPTIFARSPYWDNFCFSKTGNFMKGRI